MAKKMAVVWLLVGVSVGAVAVGAYGASAQSGTGVGTWQLVATPIPKIAWRINSVTGTLDYCIYEQANAGCIRVER